MLQYAVLPRSAVLAAGASAGILKVPSPLAGTIASVRVLVSTPNGSGASLFDVNVNGTTIFTDQSTRPNLAAGATSVLVSSLTAPVAAGDLITVDADSIPAGGFAANTLVVIITINDGLTLPVFTADVLTPRQVYAFEPLSGALAMADPALTPDAVILDLYYGALARLPTTSELTSARAALLAGLNAGSAALLQAIRTLGHTLFTSSEYGARGRTNTQFVHDLYFAYLGRDSDAMGQAGWEAALTGGATRSTVDTDFSAGTELSNIRFPRMVGAGASARGANPMTTAGDIIVGGTGGAETRVAKPAANYVWGTNAGGVLGYKPDPVSASSGVAPFDANHPDALPASANALDDEFTGASLNTSTKWAWSNQGAATAALADSHLTLSYPTVGGTGNNSVPSIVQPISGTFRVRAKIQLYGDAASSGGGIIIRENSSGKQINFSIYTATGNWTIERQDSATGARTSLASVAAPAGTHEAYLEIEEDATTRYFRYSLSGRAGTFFTVLSHAKTTHITATDRIGLCLFPFNGKILLVSDWFRRIS